ncbi:hypothetical protein ACIREO_39015 [Streptomyces sp. NPDC102441]|uniref:hypothetical protein n=1 Tax=Streptomyces sp. NPDC102441 TaxID=3366176 RepID=UPI00381826DB
MTSSPQFTKLDRLTSDEVGALRDLFCACADLRHELRSADVLGHRVDQTLSNTNRYTEGQRFTRHAGALLALEQATVDYEIEVENLAWKHVSACVMLATALLDRLATNAPGLSVETLEELTSEPWMSVLCAGLSLPGERLLPGCSGGPLDHFELDRKKMLARAEALGGRNVADGGLDFLLTEAKTGGPFGDMGPWFDWANYLVAQEIAHRGQSIS